MLIAKLQQFGTSFLPRTLLLVLFISLAGLAYMWPALFLEVLLLTSFLSLIFTSVYYLWKGVFAFALMV